MGVAAERLFDAPRLLMNRSSTGLSPDLLHFRPIRENAVRL
jgi:hypothetical protein